MHYKILDQTVNAISYIKVKYIYRNDKCFQAANQENFYIMQ